MGKFDLDADYNEVKFRIVEFRTKHPEGSLQPADLASPYRVETIGGDTYIVVVAAAYRAPDDVRPGIGMAYEVFPGKTPYTRGSELMNAETSAWGRAIVAVLAADTSKSVASATEVRNRSAEREPKPAGKPADKPTVQLSPLAAVRARLDTIARAKGLNLVDEFTRWISDADVDMPGNRAFTLGTADTATLTAFADSLSPEPSTKVKRA